MWAFSSLQMSILFLNSHYPLTTCLTNMDSHFPKSKGHQPPPASICGYQRPYHLPQPPAPPLAIQFSGNFLYWDLSIVSFRGFVNTEHRDSTDQGHIPQGTDLPSSRVIALRPFRFLMARQKSQYACISTLTY